MTRREMLVEQYEDALFSLLMDEVAEAEGQKALEENQRLRESGELVVPDGVRQRCQKVIAHKTAVRDFKRIRGGFTKVVTKVAIVVLVAMLLFTTAFAVSEDLRVKALNFVMEVFDDRTEIKIIPEDLPSNVNQSAAPQVIAGWLPDGFALAEEGQESFGRWYEYTDADEGMISVDVINIVNANMMIDTEDADTSSIQVQDSDALLVEKDGKKQLVWQLREGEEWCCYIVAKNISIEALLRFAQHIVIS